jgi:ubiquinone/menaquinone biosynthesis C-methylase UbiE
MSQHQQSILQSFSPNAEAYLTSPVHSAGADLDLLARATAALDRPVVLDLGCGAGHVSFAVSPFAKEVVAFDLSTSMLDVVAATAKERQLLNIGTRQGSVEELPFGGEQFDLVLSRYSAHHWNHVPQALNEVRRVLRPNGQVCFVDIAGGPSPMLDTHLQAVELMRDPSHVRDYTRSEWHALFEAASFQAHIASEWRLPLEFSSWVARISTSAERIAAIRSLWSGAPSEVRTYFRLQDDLSFEIDAIMISARRT